MSFAECVQEFDRILGRYAGTDRNPSDFLVEMRAVATRAGGLLIELVRDGWMEPPSGNPPWLQLALAPDSRVRIVEFKNTRWEHGVSGGAKLQLQSLPGVLEEYQAQLEQEGASPDGRCPDPSLFVQRHALYEAGTTWLADRYPGRIDDLSLPDWECKTDDGRDIILVSDCAKFDPLTGESAIAMPLTRVCRQACALLAEIEAVLSSARGEPQRGEGGEEQLAPDEVLDLVYGSDPDNNDVHWMHASSLVAEWREYARQFLSRDPMILPRRVPPRFRALTTALTNLLRKLLGAGSLRRDQYRETVVAVVEHFHRCCDLYTSVPPTSADVLREAYGAASRETEKLLCILEGGEIPANTVCGPVEDGRHESKLSATDDSKRGVEIAGDCANRGEDLPAAEALSLDGHDDPGDSDDELVALWEVATIADRTKSALRKRPNRPQPAKMRGQSHYFRKSDVIRWLRDEISELRLRQGFRVWAGVRREMTLKTRASQRREFAKRMTRESN